MKQGALLVLLAAVWLAACASPTNDLMKFQDVNKGDLIVSINGTEIREGFLDTLIKINPRFEAQLKDPVQKKKLIGQIVDQRLLYEEAVRQNLDDSDAVVFKSLVDRHQNVAGALVERELNDTMKKAYEEKKDSQFTKVAISQIVVRFDGGEDKKDDKSTKGGKNSKDKSKSKEDKDGAIKPEDKAKALIKAQDLKKRLDKGEDFAKLAGELSDDKMTKAKGGKAGQIGRDEKRYQSKGLKKVLEEAFKLPRDAVSDPIETDKAYFIIKVTSDPIVTPFDVAQRELGMVMQGKIRSDLIGGLKKNAKIGWGDKYKDFANASPDTPAKIQVQPGKGPMLGKDPTVAPQPEPSQDNPQDQLGGGNPKAGPDTSAPQDPRTH